MRGDVPMWLWMTLIFIIIPFSPVSFRILIIALAQFGRDVVGQRDEHQLIGVSVLEDISTDAVGVFEVCVVQLVRGGEADGPLESHVHTWLDFVTQACS